MPHIPLTERWARFGVANKRWFIHVPRGGVCLSAFVLVRDRRGDVLMGRPRVHRAWPERGGLPLWRVHEIVRAGEWVLPATHLLMEESPDRAARRIAADWVGLRNVRPKLLAIDSSRRRTAKRAGSGRTRRPVYHWDIGFVYELRVSRLPPAPPAWAEWRFVPRAEWKQIAVGRAHSDLLAYVR